MHRPELLEQSLEEHPKCLFCSKDVIQSGEMYMAEAAFRQYPDKEVIDTIFSYVICLSCYEREKSSISLASQKTMQNFFEERIQVEQLQTKFDPKYGLSQCAINGLEAHQMESFQIGALCHERELAPGFGAMLFSEQAMDELILLLSDQTREYLNGIRDKLPSIPPEFEDLFKDRPLILM